MPSDLALRALLLLGGLACVACEVWGTYDFLWEKHAHWNYLVVGGIVLTSLAVLLPLAAEYARRRELRALKWAAWSAIPLALAFVFTVSIQRTGTAADTDETQRKQIAEDIKIAEAEQAEALDQLKADKALAKSSCADGVIGTKCKTAMSAQSKTEEKLAGARAVLMKHGVEIDDSMARRIVAYLPFLTKEQVLLYQPMLLPMGLAMIGSLLLAIGSRGGKRPKQRDNRAIETMQPAPQGIVSAAPRNVALAAVSETELDPNPVVLFLKRKLAIARGVNADLAEIYERFLQDWYAQGHESEPLTPAQFGLVINYICREARIRMERRGKRVVCVDRKLVA